MERAAAMRGSPSALRQLGRVIALIASLLLTCATAHAHLLNMSKIQVAVTAGAVDVDVQVDMTRSAGGGSEYFRLSRVVHPLENTELKALFAQLARSIVITLNGQPIALTTLAAELPDQLAEQDFVSPVSWPMTHVRLGGSLPASATAQATLIGRFGADFHFEEPIALTFIAQPEGRSMTRWLVAGQTSPAFPLDAQGAASASVQEADTTTLVQYLTFGFTHILPKGLDHVLFVLGLYLGARSFKSLFLWITCFTLAHSITLGLASLGVVRLPANIVEPLIAASIVWVGLENLFDTRLTRWRPAVVFCFGLLHGLGFASALAELKLSQQHFLVNLLTFNIGIELGQLTVIAIAMIVTLGLHRRAWYRQRVASPASLAIACVAALWTVQRILQ